LKISTSLKKALRTSLKIGVFFNFLPIGPCTLILTLDFSSSVSVETAFHLLHWILPVLLTRIK
jgi:hypothetical protein